MPGFEYQFVPWGSVMEPQQGKLIVDVGNKLIPGVIDHHQADSFIGCAASQIERDPELVLAHKRTFPGDDVTLIMHYEPDLDCVTSAFFALQLWSHGRLPDGAAPLARYVDLVDSGRLPPGTPLESSLHTVFLAAQQRIHERHAGGRLDLYTACVDRGFELLEYALERYRAADAKGQASRFSFHAPSLFSGSHGFRKELRFLADDYERYRADLERSEAHEAWVLSQSRTRLTPVDGLTVVDPKSTMFKYFARTDLDHSKSGRGFGLLHVIHPHALPQGDRHIISVDPEPLLSLRGLGERLEEMEIETRKRRGLRRGSKPRFPDSANDDPWYDGRGPLHRYTIVDSPRAGTLLDTETVEAVVLMDPQNPDSWQRSELLQSVWLCPRCFGESAVPGMCDQHGTERIPSIVDGYRLRRRLGAGAMGEVFEVDDLRRGRLAALKLIAQGFGGENDQAAKDKFFREARLATAQSHPNLVETYDRGEDEVVGLWLVMERLQGEDLGASIKAWFTEHEGEPYPPRRARWIIEEVCRGLHALHLRQVVHKDLKPTNVFLCRRDHGWPRVKLLDFGVSRQSGMIAGEDTVSGMVSGTPQYMPPEAFTGRVGTLNDVYALGCVL